MNGMIALRTIVYFLVTSLISALIGLALVLIVHPGNPETKDQLGEGNTAERKVDIVDNFMDLGRNLFPDNLFLASFKTAYTKYEGEGDKAEPTIAYRYNNTTMLHTLTSFCSNILLCCRSGTNTLGIIFFCLTFGTVLGSLGKKGKIVIDFFHTIDEVIMKMVYGIMW